MIRRIVRAIAAFPGLLMAAARRRRVAAKLLELAGWGALTRAAWLVAEPAGWAAGGVALIYLAFASSRPEPPEPGRR
jgi:hypothetical protein